MSFGNAKSEEAFHKIAGWYNEHAKKMAHAYATASPAESLEDQVLAAADQRLPPWSYSERMLLESVRNDVVRVIQGHGQTTITTLKSPKAPLSFRNAPIWWLCALALALSPELRVLVVARCQGDCRSARDLVARECVNMTTASIAGRLMQRCATMHAGESRRGVDADLIVVDNTHDTPIQEELLQTVHSVAGVAGPRAVWFLEQHDLQQTNENEKT